MALTLDERVKVVEAHGRCYGLLSIAERYLNSLSYNIGQAAIESCWDDEKLQTRKIGEVLESMVKELYPVFKGDLVLIAREIRRRIPCYRITDAGLEPYLKRLGIKKDSGKRGNGGNPNRECRRQKAGMKPKRIYGFFMPPEAI